MTGCVSFTDQLKGVVSKWGKLHLCFTQHKVRWNQTGSPQLFLSVCVCVSSSSISYMSVLVELDMAYLALE